MKNRSRSILPLSVCALALSVVATAPAFGLQLTQDGAAAGVIVHNGNTDVAPRMKRRILGVHRDTIQPAVQELQDYLETMTGAELPLVASLEEAGDRPAIVLEVIAGARLPQASDADTGKQAYHIKTEGNRLFLRAANDLSLYNAVYGFLEDHLGCHFYSYRLRRGGHGASYYEGPGYEVVPERPTLEIEEIDDFQEPALASRGLIFRMGGFPWILKNRAIGVGGNTSGARASGHTMYKWINPKDEQVWTHTSEGRKRVTKEGLLEAHPEFFPMNKHGKRKPDTWNMGICGTAEELPGHLAERIIESMGDKPKDASALLGIGQGDGFQGCHCPDCRKLVHEQGSEAAPLIHMFNQTLDIVNEQYPNVEIITFCYFNSLEAPKKMKAHENLWINVVSSARSKNAAGDQMGPIQNNPGNADYERALKEWPHVAPDRVTVWHWDTYRAEWPSMFYIDDNVRYMVDCGVYGINPQTCGGPWDQLINWVYMRLAWNPDLDGDKLVMQYVKDIYGEAAAPHVYAYLQRGKRAYEDALWNPSAVRWSGWTRITMDKLFPESVRDEMVALMDKALAACEKNGTKEQIAELRSARADSIDKVVMEAANRIGPWGMVKYEGHNWFVPGASKHVPAIVQSNKELRTNNLAWITRYTRNKGGPVTELGGKGMRAVVCPALGGQLVSAVQAKSGTELLHARSAEAGYKDLFGTIHTQAWLPVTEKHANARAELQPTDGGWANVWTDFKTSKSFLKELTGGRARELRTETILAGKKFTTDNTLHRTVALAEDGLVVERSYTGSAKTPGQFSTRWRLAMPHPDKSRLTVSGGGIKELMDLRYAEPGGIRMVKAGERPPGYEGLDAMDEKWDAVKAVSDAQVVEFEVTEDEGTLEILLDRGDGQAAVVATPADGWSALKIKPVIGEHYVELILVGAPVEADGDRVESLSLPTQTLSAKAVPPAEAVADEAQPDPRIRVTGENTAVNEADGAELVWIPAGAFPRGSDSDNAGADEQPVRDIHLDGYWVYKYPVTVGQYKAYCRAKEIEFKPPWPQNMKANPEGDPDTYAVTVNWFDARNYAKWVAGDLPTEAQWEKAARGSDGREYPWGDEYDPAKCVSMENTLYEFNEGFRPVGSHPEGASPYGVMDMAGNVLEWTRDWYRYEYYAESPDANPTGPKHGANKVVRGGSSLYDWRFNRSAARFVQPPTVDNWTGVGFRVVLDANKDGSPKAE